MKKLFFILFVVLFATVAMMGNARADSVQAHINGSDGVMPNYGLSYEIENQIGYVNLQDSTNKQFQTNTPLVSGGVKAGPFNSGVVAGAQIQQSSGTISGMAGVELGITAAISGPFFVQENNRLLRGAGGVSDSQIDLGLGVRF